MSIWVSQSVDMAIPCQEGTVTIAIRDRPAPIHALRDPDPQAVRQAVEGLGGELPAAPD